jgi:hypothetical protein
MYGEYLKSIGSRLLSALGTFFWFAGGDVEAETVSEIIAAQDLAQRTKRCAANMFTAETDIKCRICQNYEEAGYHGLGKGT